MKSSVPPNGNRQSTIDDSSSPLANCKSQIANAVDPEAFHGLISVRAGALLALARQLQLFNAQEHPAALEVLNRPFLALMLAQTSQLEELLDAYGAVSNSQWYRFRRLVATIKLFASAHYQLLHLIHTAPSYRLLPVDGDFMADTRAAADITGAAILEAGRRLLDRAKALDLPVYETTFASEDLPTGKLARDREARKAQSAEETIVRLATAFLNVAEDGELLTDCLQGDGRSPLPAEGELRQLEYRFHNLQTLYDTYVSNTDIENIDDNLPVLRGHVSVVFHLLEITTGLEHYRERHTPDENDRSITPVLPPEAIDRLIRRFAIAYAVRYLKAGRDLCQTMLKRYAEMGDITVQVPRYRGFHVRPSTLVSKIVLHYGSPVSMELDGESYDASIPFELFRANEKINADKRHWLAQETNRLLTSMEEARLGRDIMLVVKRIAMTLAEQNKVIIYEYPLPTSSPLEKEEAPGVNFIIDELTRLQSMGKIDIETALNVTFHGDKRVLNDLRVLADTGYGEDKFGNNIPLPSQLAYLRR